MLLQKLFLLLTTAFVVGDCLGLLLTTHELAYALCATLAIFVMLKIINKHSKTIVLACLFLFLLLGTFVGYHNRLSIIEQAVAPYINQQVNITGYIQNAPPVQTERFVRLKLNLAVINDSQHPKYLVNIYLPKGSDIPPAGSLVNIHAQLQEIQSFNNPSNFNLQYKSYLNNTVGTIYLKANEWTIIDIPKYPSILTRLQLFANIYREKLLEIMPAQHAALLKSLVLGGSSDIPTSIWQDFTLTGLIHVLCISGLHTTLVAMLIMSVCRLILRNDQYAALVSIFFVLIYVLLAGLSLPVVRAGIMSSLILAGYLVGRKGHTPAIFTFTLLMMVIYKPNTVLDLSFQLTFLATGSLIFITPRISEFLSNHIDSKPLRLSIAAVLSVQIMLLPILVNNFHQLSLISLISNLLLVPIIELIISFIIAGSIFLFIVPPLGKITLVCSSIFLDGVVYLNSFLANLPMSIISIPHLPLRAIFLYYLLLYLTLFPMTSLKNIRYYKELLAALFTLMLICIVFIQPQKLASSQLHFIDVGQGDAVLLVSKNNRAILIDTGGLGPTFDIASRVVNPYLRYYGIKQIDLMILSHAHYDHAGGSIGISQNFPVANIIMPANSSEVTETLERKLTHTKFIKAELGQLNLDEWQLDIIYLPQTTDPNDSLVLKARNQDFSVLFTGDIDSKVEEKLLGQLDKTTVLKVAHHGSAQSSSEDFLQLIQPTVAVISVGKNNRYGHPTTQALERLHTYADQVLRTDQHGAIVITFIANEIFININKKEFR